MGTSTNALDRAWFLNAGALAPGRRSGLPLAPPLGLMYESVSCLVRVLMWRVSVAETPVFFMSRCVALALEVGRVDGPELSAPLVRLHSVTIDWELVGRVVVGGLPVAVTLLGLLRGPGALRSTLKHDLALLEQLPETSPARGTWLKHIEMQVERIRLLDSEGKRSWQDFGIALGLVVALLAGTVWLWGLSAWWQLAIAGVLAIFALAGMSTMFEALQRVPRDEKGKPT